MSQLQEVFLGLILLVTESHPGQLLFTPFLKERGLQILPSSFFPKLWSLTLPFHFHLTSGRQWLQNKQAGKQRKKCKAIKVSQLEHFVAK